MRDDSSPGTQGHTTDHSVYNAVADPREHEVDPDTLNPKEPPRHDRYADENSPWPTPERVVPSTPTNANPDFADYARVVQDRPGYADGTDKVEVEQALELAPLQEVPPQEEGFHPSRDLSTTAATGLTTTAHMGQGRPDPDDVPDPVITHESPDIPRAGEGAFEERLPTEEATGAVSPIGDPHGDQTGDPPVDTYDEAKALGESHEGGQLAPDPEPDPDDTQEMDAVTTPQDPVEDTAAEPEPGPPSASALKSEWVDYVVANYEITRESAEGMTKAELVATYGE